MEIIEKQKGLGINQVPITTKPSCSKYYILQGGVRKSKRGLAMSQVPITTQYPIPNYYMNSQLLAVTLKIKKSRPISRR